FDLEGELEVIKCTGWDEKIISKEECTLAEKEKVHLYIQEQLLNLIYEYLYSGEHIEFAFECLKQITVFKKNKYLADISSSVFVGDREGLLRYRQILHASHQYIPALTVQELDDLLQLLDERIWMMDRLVIVPLLESGVEADVDSAFEYMKKIDSECGKTSLLEYLVDMDTDGSLCGRLKTIFNDARYSEEITIAVDIKLVDSLLVNDTPETRSPLFNYLIVIDKYGSFARKDAVIDNLECMDQGELLQVLEDQGYFKEVFERHKMLYEKHLPEGGGGGAKGLEE
ncbi:hypothetical protein K0U07_02940, partial [bacterium]|nr:hypothetical protein [bacterium]